MIPIALACRRFLLQVGRFVSVVSALVLVPAVSAATDHQFTPVGCYKRGNGKDRWYASGIHQQVGGGGTLLTPQVRV